MGFVWSFFFSLLLVVLPGDNRASSRAGNDRGHLAASFRYIVRKIISVNCYQRGLSP